jgi:hypothetical protein
MNVSTKQHRIADVTQRNLDTEEPYAGRSSRQDCNLTGESPAVSVTRVGHVVMPHPGMGNHPGYAWCKRPGRPVDYCGGCDLEA